MKMAQLPVAWMLKGIVQRDLKKKKKSLGFASFFHERQLRCLSILWSMEVAAVSWEDGIALSLFSKL